MKGAIDETNRRRQKQIEYNTIHQIEPKSIIKRIHPLIESIPEKPFKISIEKIPNTDLPLYIQELEISMHEAAAALEFEKAAIIRDELLRIKKELKETAK